eukprot:jgi/Mesvir1/17930/Mv12989-RA.1
MAGELDGCLPGLEHLGGIDAKSTPEKSRRRSNAGGDSEDEGKSVDKDSNPRKRARVSMTSMASEIDQRLLLDNFMQDRRFQTHVMASSLDSFHVAEDISNTPPRRRPSASAGDSQGCGVFSAMSEDSSECVEMPMPHTRSHGGTSTWGGTLLGPTREMSCGRDGPPPVRTSCALSTSSSVSMSDADDASDQHTDCASSDAHLLMRSSVWLQANLRGHMRAPPSPSDAAINTGGLRRTALLRSLHLRNSSEFLMVPPLPSDINEPMPPLVPPGCAPNYRITQ